MSKKIKFEKIAKGKLEVVEGNRPLTLDLSGLDEDCAILVVSGVRNLSRTDLDSLKVGASELPVDMMFRLGDDPVTDKSDFLHKFANGDVSGMAIAVELSTEVAESIIDEDDETPQTWVQRYVTYPSVDGTMVGVQLSPKSNEAGGFTSGNMTDAHVRAMAVRFGGPEFLMSPLEARELFASESYVQPESEV